VTRFRPIRNCLAPLAFLAIAPVVAQTTAEPATTPAVAPLEQAKRELEATKGGRIKESESGLRELRTAVPPMSLPVAPTAPPPTPRAEARNAAEKPGRNWLVEAMERKPGANAGKGEGRAERPGREMLLDETGSESDGREREGLSSTREAAREPRRGEREREGERKREAEVNPFARYLREWVSPQDFALLQSTVTAPRDTGAAKTAGYVSADESDISSAVATSRRGDMGLTAYFGGRGPGPETASARGRTAENPFLQFLPGEISASRSAAQVPGAPSQPNPGFSPAQPVIGPPVAPNPRGAVPDFVRPIADDKLYRQLKRF
jgi:hypothetical protein